MKARFSVAIALAFFIAQTEIALCAPATPPALLSVPMERVTQSKDVDDAFLRLNPCIIAQPRQEATEKGLRFQIEVANPGDTAVSLRSFFDFLQINLKDSGGRRLWLPPVVGPTRAEKLNASRHSMRPRDPDDYKLNVPFLIESVTIDEKALSRADIFEGLEFTIPPQKSLRASIALEKVLVSTNPGLPARERSPGPVPPGTYSIEMMSELISANGRWQITLFRTGRKSDSKIEVAYGVATAGSATPPAK